MQTQYKNKLINQEKDGTPHIVPVRGTPFRHAFPSRTLLLLPTPPPPSDTSSAFRCIFHLPMHLLPSNVSSASRCVFCFATCLTPPDLSPAPASHGMSHLPRHISSPASGLAIYRHPGVSHDIMRHTVTSHNPRGTSHLPLAFRSRPGCPATSQDIPRLPLLLLLSHPWDIPQLPGIP